MKIAINKCWGAFCLSQKSVEMLEKHGIKTDKWAEKLERNDPKLIQVIEELGDEASERGEKIRVIEIPDDVKDWYIVDYDGLEHVGEGRTWY